MKKILVTGGTTFVSKYVAEYFVNAGYEVYVLNRNTKPQVQGVHRADPVPVHHQEAPGGGPQHAAGGLARDHRLPAMRV